ncbi:MAG TPA: hypothetical protein VLY21_02275 [Nitrososphaerales archaeon]|nr:hypothetical protein [Nitrososphaerales archaeon]
MGQVSVYYPRRIGIVTPRGEKIFKFVVVAEDKQGYFFKILNIISGHYVNLSSSFTYSDVASGTFMVNVVGDMKHADRTSSEIKDEIAALPFVKSVDVESAQDVLFDKMLFPLMIAGDLRAVVLPVSALIEREHKVLEGPGGRETIMESQRPLGASLVATLRTFLPWIDSEALTQAASDALCALGWGFFDFDTTELKKGRVKITVRYPIFSESPGENISYSIIGLTAGVMEGCNGFRFVPIGKVTYNEESKEMKFELEQFQEKTPTK